MLPWFLPRKNPWQLRMLVGSLSWWCRRVRLRVVVVLRRWRGGIVEHGDWFADWAKNCLFFFLYGWNQEISTIEATKRIGIDTSVELMITRIRSSHALELARITTPFIYGYTMNWDFQLRGLWTPFTVSSGMILQVWYCLHMPEIKGYSKTISRKVI